MTGGDEKYFIAVIPPEPLFGIIQGLKSHLKEAYGAKAALRSPAHITLHMPFQWPARKEQRLVDSLLQYTAQQKPFGLRLNNFSCFPPRVIYVAVEGSTPLTELQRSLHRHCKVNLNLFNANYQDRPFHPHITLAFRDLKKSAFEPAWNEFSNRELAGTFNVESIYLLKHTGTAWERFAELPFNAM
jgi:2'-5' RNA ligase